MPTPHASGRRAFGAGRPPPGALWLGVAALLLLAIPHTLGAQGGGPPLAAQGQQDLNFGELLAGLPGTVPPTDPAGSAQIRIRGRAGQVLEFSFELPTALAGPQSGSVPLQFDPGDAHFSASGGTADRVPFDPSIPWTVTLDQQGWSWVFLGGTAHPSIGTPPGPYGASITLTISDLGR